MAPHTFFIVDVFAEEKLAGNQLAVALDAADLTGEEMQRIASEMSYSETTFIISGEQRGGGYDVRIFTPVREVPFAGHPTLGTAYVLQREVIGRPVETVLLNLGVGQVPVEICYSGDQTDILWMIQKPPAFGREFEPGPVARALDLDERDLDARFPVREVSTGIPFMIVPLVSLDALKRARVDREKLSELVADAEAKAVLVFCPETRSPENDLSVRVFAGYYGVPEDPATGSANGCLAGYLVEHRYFGEDPIDLRVEQGHEIGRPSLLLLKAEVAEGGIDVRVGGRVQMVARGELV